MGVTAEDSARHRPARPRQVLARAADLPWRERAFWITQLLVVCTIGLHVVADLYGSDLVHVPAVATLVLTVVPVGYAAIRYGLRGSLPTAVWTVALMLPDIVWLDTAPDRWTDGSMLALVVTVAVAGGRAVDAQHASSASQVAAERLRSMAGLADQLLEGICATDLRGVISYANPAWARMQGLTSPQEAVGRTLASFHVAVAAGPGTTPYPYELALDPARPARSLIEHPRDDGSRLWAEVTVTPLLDGKGRTIGRLSTVQDVTAARTAAVALEEAEERFRLTFERAPLGMALTTPEGDFLQVNDALCEMLGRNAPEIVALGVFGLTHPDDIESTQQMFRQHGSQERLVKRYLHGDGHFVSVQITATLVRDHLGEPRYWIAQFQDVTTDERSRLQLTRQAFHDPLTGLPNRLLFEDRVRQALARAHRERGTLALVFCDLDDFKTINDRYGHQSGDDVLRSVAARIEGCLREADTAARFGGDEFVLLLDGLSEPAQAIAAADRVQAAFGQPHSLGGRQVTLGVSIGIAINCPRTIALETLLEQADRAMYEAKAAGGNCSRLFGALPA